MTRRSTVVGRFLPLALLSLVTSPTHAAFTINISAGATLSGNVAALAAFNRAATQWTSRISDNITVTVNADLGTFANNNIIGSTSSVTLAADYNTIRNAIVADDATSALKAALPTAAQFSAVLPSGGSLSGNIFATKANLKALNFTNLDSSFGVSDGAITFNSAFAFDYDNSDGVGAGLVDFETVAAHEIGHLLGFVSAVDSVDAGAITNLSFSTLDLYRFDSASAPSSLSAFTTTARDFRTGGTKVTSSASANVFQNSGGTPIASLEMSTGVSQGDGNQASHWKADDITGVNIGIMDPTLATQQITPVGYNDFAAMGLIGYNVTVVPEPATWLLFAPGLLLSIIRRSKYTC